MLKDIQETIRSKDLKIHRLEKIMEEWEENFSPIFRLDPLVLEELTHNQQKFNNKKPICNQIKTFDSSIHLSTLIEITTPKRLKILIDELVKEICSYKKKIKKIEFEYNLIIQKEKSLIDKNSTLVRQQCQQEILYVTEKMKQQKIDLEYSCQSQIKNLQSELATTIRRFQNFDAILKNHETMLNHANNTIHELQKEKKKLIKECNKHKITAQQKWIHFKEYAQQYVEKDYLDKMIALQEQIDNLKTQEKMLIEKNNQLEIKYNENHIKPILEQLKLSQKHHAAITAENTL